MNDERVYDFFLDDNRCSVAVDCVIICLIVFGAICVATHYYQKDDKPTQSPKVQVKQTLSGIDKSSYAVVTRSVEIHNNDQTTYEVELDRDGDGKADYRVKFNEAAFLSKGEKVNIVSLIKHPTFNNFSVLERQKENF